VLVVTLHDSTGVREGIEIRLVVWVSQNLRTPPEIEEPTQALYVSSSMKPTSILWVQQAQRKLTSL